MHRRDEVGGNRHEPPPRRANHQRERANPAAGRSPPTTPVRDPQRTCDTRQGAPPSMESHREAVTRGARKNTSMSPKGRLRTAIDPSRGSSGTGPSPDRPRRSSATTSPPEVQLLLDQFADRRIRGSVTAGLRRRPRSPSRQDRDRLHLAARTDRPKRRRPVAGSGRAGSTTRDPRIGGSAATGGLSPRRQRTHPRLRRTHPEEGGRTCRACPGTRSAGNRDPSHVPTRRGAPARTAVRGPPDRRSRRASARPKIARTLSTADSSTLSRRPSSLGSAGSRRASAARSTPVRSAPSLTTRRAKPAATRSSATSRPAARRATSNAGKSRSTWPGSTGRSRDHG